MNDAAAAGEIVCRAACGRGDDHTVRDSFGQEATADVDRYMGEMRGCASVDDDFVHCVNRGVVFGR